MTYPSSGSYGVGISATGACSDYSSTVRPVLGKGCGGCSSASDCSDGNSCTADKCVQGKCQHPKIPGCCKKASDCSDGDACTKDSCIQGKCQNKKTFGCCTSDAACDDQDVCTLDRCDVARRSCTNAKIPSCTSVSPTPGGPGNGAGPRGGSDPDSQGGELIGGCSLGNGPDTQGAIILVLCMLLAIRYGRARRPARRY